MMMMVMMMRRTITITTRKVHRGIIELLSIRILSVPMIGIISMTLTSKLLEETKELFMMMTRKW
jgi:hypothetical protein